MPSLDNKQQVPIINIEFEDLDRTLGIWNTENGKANKTT